MELLRGQSGRHCKSVAELHKKSLQALVNKPLSKGPDNLPNWHLFMFNLPIPEAVMQPVKFMVHLVVRASLDFVRMLLRWLIVRTTSICYLINEIGFL